MVAGALVQDILNGTQPGSFGWLSWTGDNGEPTLARSMPRPATATATSTPIRRRTTLSRWATGSALALVSPTAPRFEGRSTSSNRSTLLFPYGMRQPARVRMRVTEWAGFARVRLVDYRLPGSNTITVQFLGYVACGGGQPLAAAAIGATEAGPPIASGASGAASVASARADADRTANPSWLDRLGAVTQLFRQWLTGQSDNSVPANSSSAPLTDGETASLPGRASGSRSRSAVRSSSRSVPHADAAEDAVVEGDELRLGHQEHHVEAEGLQERQIMADH